MAKEKTPSILKRLTPYMGERKILFPISIVLSVLSAVVGILPFLYLRNLIAEMLTARGAMDQGVVLQTAGFVFLFAFLAVLLYFFSLLLSHVAAFRVEVGMQKHALKTIFAMPLGFFAENSSGRIRKIVNDGATSTHSYLAHNLPDLASAFVSPIILLALMFVIDWRLALASFIPLLVAFGIMSSLQAHGNRENFQKRYFDSLELMSSEAVEYVRAIPVVKTFGQSIRAFERFYNSIIGYRDMVKAFTLSWEKPYSLYQASLQSAAFFLIPFAILLIGRGEDMNLVLADFIFYLIVAPSFSTALMRVMMLNQNTMITKQTIDRFDALLSYPTIDHSDKPVDLADHSIEFKNVVFEYNDAGRNAVDGISFKINPGERIALVGMSGSGKTTIARLAARFWETNEGEILIGGRPLREIPKAQLMTLISFVFQNSKLFKMSLRDNIVFGHEGHSEEDLANAIRLSQSQDIIDALPQGLDTMIGSQGVYLSGGEQQRIALARAILKDAPIVFLDEATAFADPENEVLIQEALQALSQGKTSLTIAHRLTSVQDADRILVVEEGKIVQDGRHDDLVQVEGRYKTMWEDYLKSLDWKLSSAKEVPSHD